MSISSYGLKGARASKYFNTVRKGARLGELLVCTCCVVVFARAREHEAKTATEERARLIYMGVCTRIYLHDSLRAPTQNKSGR